MVSEAHTLIMAFAVNAIGARNVAQATDKCNAVLLHISTDYVFDGRKGQPYVEDDSPGPVNVYASSKLAGEYLVRATAVKHFVVRVSGLYGRHPCRGKGGRNFVTTMLRLGRERPEVRVVDDEFVSPTHTKDIGLQLPSLTQTEAYGTYHVAAHGHCSWYEFASKIFELANMRTKVSVAMPGEFAGKTLRPHYTALSNASLHRLAIDRMPPWDESLKEFIRLIC